jgi:hypothetical protein
MAFLPDAFSRLGLRTRDANVLAVLGSWPRLRSWAKRLLLAGQRPLRLRRLRPMLLLLRRRWGWIRRGAVEGLDFNA